MSNVFWKSPRPEIPDSDLFSYDEGEVRIVLDAKFNSNLTTGTLIKGIPVMQEAESKGVKISAEYNEELISSIVKAWISK
jgi:hypothetical protein